MNSSTLFFDFGRSFLFTVATLLPMLNPPAAAPIFLTLTEGATTSARTELAKRVSINIFIMLAVATVAGNIVLNFLVYRFPLSGSVAGCWLLQRHGGSSVPLTSMPVMRRTWPGNTRGSRYDPKPFTP